MADQLVRCHFRKGTMMKFTHKRTVTPSGKIRVLTLPDWDTFSSATVLPELEALMLEGRAMIERIAAIPSPTFAELVTDSEDLFERLSLVVGPMGHLNATMQKKYPELKGPEGINAKASQLLTNFSSDLSLHEGLYFAHLRFVKSAEYAGLASAERHLIDRTIKEFTLAGVGLSPEEKAKLKLLNDEGSALGIAFSDNDLESTDAWQKHVLDEAVLAGVPDSDKSRMKDAAKEKSLEGFLITLQQPDVMAIFTYALSRELREEVQRGYATVASELRDEGKWDNAPVMRSILRNAHESARLLGHPTYADKSLATKMAASVGVEGVRKFTDDLIVLARPKAEVEFAAMKAFAAKELGITDFMPWDFSFVYERMMQALYRVDQEKVREYFPFGKVMSGLTTLLERIYGVRIIEGAVSVWREGVKFYEVYDGENVLRGAFYADMYAREGKRSGAWMDVLIASRHLLDGMQVPLAYLNCNASRPSDGGEAYLTHGDVETLFHESGHVFHHLMGLTEHPDLSMNHVEWDTVELPSQFLENWCWDKEMLQFMSEHKETKEVIPLELIERMLAAKYFNTGLVTLRQLCLGYFDLELYSKYDPANPIDPNALWEHIVTTIEVRPSHPESRFPNSFSHIFAGGYSAGYFSYMWALGLAADARRVFDESGDIFSRAVGERFVKEVLAPGSSRPMAESFRAFRGRDLDPKALAIHLGLIEK